MKNNNPSQGIGCPSVILLVFVILKLTNLIDWSWWWVLSPLWISVIVIAVLLIIALIINS